MPYLLVVYLVIAVYTFACSMVAYAGRKRKTGYWGTLFLSLILTPILVGLFLLLFKKHDKEENPI